MRFNVGRSGPVEATEDRKMVPTVSDCYTFFPRCKVSIFAHAATITSVPITIAPGPRPITKMYVAKQINVKFISTPMFASE